MKNFEFTILSSLALFFFLLSAWLARENLELRKAATVSYTQGIIKGAADSAAKPRTCNWQDLFGATK